MSLCVSSRRQSETCEGSRVACGRAGSATGWGRLGDLRKNTLRHFAEAEDAYNRAPAIDGGLASEIAIRHPLFGRLFGYSGNTRIA